MLEILAFYFNCERVKVANNRDSAEWVLARFADIHLIIIPFFNLYLLLGGG